mgnify:CR=1 FL=1
MSPGKCTKQQLRDEVRRTVRTLTSEERLEASEAVTEAIVTSPIWAAADTVFAFVSLPDEVETTTICEQALVEQKLLGLPRFGEEGLVFHEVTDLDELRIDNSMAIRQPNRELSVLASTLAPRQPGRLLIITPGRAFTPEGDRLGRGGGFYDAFFAALRREQIVFHALAVAFHEQIYDEIPTTDEDERVHGIVTPKRRLGLA